MMMDAFFGIFTVGFGISRNMPKYKIFRRIPNPKLKVPIYIFAGFALGLGVFITLFSTVYPYNNPYLISQIMGVSSEESVQNSTEQSLKDFEDDVEKNTHQGAGIVTIAEDFVFGPWDTEQGSITEIENTIDTSIELPLCDLHVDITKDWYVIYKVVGGYEPINGTWYFSQKGEIVYNDLIPGMYVGYNIIWTDMGHSTENCCTHYWKLTFGTACNNWACIDSNQYPAGAVPVDPDCTTIPGKEVWLNVSSLWSGCECEDQQFTLISLQDHYFVPIIGNTPENASYNHFPK